jgi:hypothetical protein
MGIAWSDATSRLEDRVEVVHLSVLFDIDGQRVRERSDLTNPALARLAWASVRRAQGGENTLRLQRSHGNPLRSS